MVSTCRKMSSWAASTLVRVVRDLNVYMDGKIPPADVLDSYTLSLELVHRDTFCPLSSEIDIQQKFLQQHSAPIIIFTNVVVYK